MPRLLVLGGSWFLGAQIVGDALAAGWDVQTFRRGQSGSTVPGAVLIQGDRASEADLARLATAGPWDAVVDTSGYVPANVGMVARALEPVAKRIVFLSTVSVYQRWPHEPVDEHAALRECASDSESDTGDVGDPGPALYGAFKSGAERAVLEVFGADRTVLLRPGVIVGPGEYVGRLPWWLRRIERGGRVLAPDRGGELIIDRCFTHGALCTVPGSVRVDTQHRISDHRAVAGAVTIEDRPVKHPRLVCIATEALSRAEHEQGTDAVAVIEMDRFREIS